MIYNTQNRNNDTTKSQKEKKTCFNAHTGGKFTVQCIVNKLERCIFLEQDVVIKKLSYFKV